MGRKVAMFFPRARVMSVTVSRTCPGWCLAGSAFPSSISVSGDVISILVTIQEKKFEPSKTSYRFMASIILLYVPVLHGALVLISKANPTKARY